MSDDIKNDQKTEELETSEWLYSLDYVLEHGGPQRVIELLQQLQIRAHKSGVHVPFTANTPYINTIPKKSRRRFRAKEKLNEELKVLSDGMQWLW